MRETILPSIISRSLFNSNEQVNTLFPSLFYPPPTMFLPSDSPFRLYHEAFIRNFLDHCVQSPLLFPPSTLIPFVSSREKSSSTNSSLPKKSSSNTRMRRCLSCNQCSYTTNRLNNLKRHIQTMHEVLPEPIDCCDQLFLSKAHFRTHVNTEHRCGYHCDICQRTFCRKALLKRHQSIHSGEKAFVCSICSYSTSHKGNLDRHARVHRHQNVQKQSTD